MDDLRQFLFFLRSWIRNSNGRTSFPVGIRAWSGQVEWGRMEPSEADRETSDGNERATFPVGRHVPTGGKKNKKKLAQVVHWYCPSSIEP